MKDERSQPPESVDPDDTDTERDDNRDARLYSTVPLEREDGSTVVIRQQNVGRDKELGGGEWPDPDTPPQPPAPGSADDA